MPGRSHGKYINQMYLRYACIADYEKAAERIGSWRVSRADAIVGVHVGGDHVSHVPRSAAVALLSTNPECTLAVGESSLL